MCIQNISTLTDQEIEGLYKLADEVLELTFETINNQFIPIDQLVEDTYELADEIIELEFYLQETKFNLTDQELIELYEQVDELVESNFDFINNKYIPKLKMIGSSSFKKIRNKLKTGLMETLSAESFNFLCEFSTYFYGERDENAFECLIETFETIIFNEDLRDFILTGDTHHNDKQCKIEALIQMLWHYIRWKSPYSNPEDLSLLGYTGISISRYKNKIHYSTIMKI